MRDGLNLLSRSDYSPPTLIFFHCYAAIYLKESSTKKMVWRKFGAKLYIREFTLGIYSLIILVPACATLLTEQDMDPCFYTLDELFSIKSHTVIFRLFQVPYFCFIMGSAVELINVVLTVFICGCVPNFWLTQEYPMNEKSIRFISLNHYRAIRTLIVFANSCLNNVGFGIHHATESVIIVFGLGQMFKDKLGSGIMLNSAMLCVIIGSIFCSFVEAYLDQTLWLASKKRITDFRWKFSSRRYLKPRLRGYPVIVYKTAWICLEFFSMNDFMKLIRKCLDMLLLIILVN